MRFWRYRTETRVRHVIRLTLRFFPVLAVLCAVPALVSAVALDSAVFFPLLPSLGLCALACFASSRHPPPEDATEGEDAVAVVLAFPLAALLSSPPYLFCCLGPLDALFEGMSGITSTGLTRYTDIEEQGFALTFLRAWQQWIGGYAIVTLTVALLPRRARGPAQMAESDIADDEGKTGRGRPDLRKRAIQVTFVYAGLTLLCIAATAWTGLPLQASLLHSLTAVSTAGFSSYNDSLQSVPRLTTACLMGFALLGAIALSDYVRPFSEKAGLRKLLAVLFALVLLSCGLSYGVFGVEREAGAAVGLFEAVQIGFSAQTTTGYSALSVPALQPLSKGLLVAGMYIGGDLGSTAGGIKIMRFFALALALYALMRRGASVPETPGDGAKGAVRLIIAWLGVTALGWPLLMLAGHAPIDALFELASALNNVGLSAGPSGGEDPPALTRTVLILAMWFGRVEILAALLLLKPSTWTKTA